MGKNPWNFIGDGAVQFASNTGGYNVLIMKIVFMLN